jgi:hypothetical protein
VQATGGRWFALPPLFPELHCQGAASAGQRLLGYLNRGFIGKINVVLELALAHEHRGACRTNPKGNGILAVKDWTSVDQPLVGKER